MTDLADPEKLRLDAYAHLDPFVCSTAQTRNLAYAMIAAADRIASQAAEIAELQYADTERQALLDSMQQIVMAQAAEIAELRKKLAAAEADRDAARAVIRRYAWTYCHSAKYGLETDCGLCPPCGMRNYLVSIGECPDELRKSMPIVTDVDAIALRKQKDPTP